VDAAIAAFIAGFTAAEGCFTSCSTEAGVRRFRYVIALGAVDGVSCAALRYAFGAGRLHQSVRRQEHYDDEVTFSVDALRDLVEVIVPFMDEWLPPSHKREQYLAWRAELLDYWEHRAKRRRSCSIDGCPNDRRAKGLCRHHYHEEFGQ
jgi:hypothetical protein